jgi:hypothetical protein
LNRLTRAAVLQLIGWIVFLTDRLEGVFCLLGRDLEWGESPEGNEVFRVEFCRSTSRSKDADSCGTKTSDCAEASAGSTCSGCSNGCTDTGGSCHGSSITTLCSASG